MLPENPLSIPDKIIATTNTFREEPPEEMREHLVYLVNQLINSDLQALAQLLYRIDIDEEKLKQLMQEHKGIDAAPIIAELIIKRQLQKIATKKQFGSTEKPGPDDVW